MLKDMKRFAILAALLFTAVTAMAQTPEEIANRMGEEFKKRAEDGVTMAIDTKVPILGKISIKTFSLGNKMRSETRMMGTEIITWTDGETEWEYDSKTNELKITKVGDPSSGSDDAELFSSVTDGYDLLLKKETDSAWYIACKKSKTNTNKNVPKSIELVVDKATYLPVSMSTRMSGVSMTIHDISFEVTEEQVAFDLGKCQGARVIDKR